ncbi:MAG TPA: class I SAM-dependent methyltransferase [Gaiellaceae bacterium]|nr:class I SAM-dependent methyltransferase [Gaiellaceae bacterium]
MSESRWTRYYDAAGEEPRPTLRRALALFAAPGVAVDLGCGTGRDTFPLLAAGWEVHAIDAEPAAIERLLAAAPANDRLHVRVARFEEAAWPRCDLVTSSFALPFCPPERFPALWRRIVASLRPGGRFAGQLFGERDEWAGDGLTVQTRAELDRLLEPFAVEHLEELEEDGRTAVGDPKHWHLYHVVARKP